ncbi:MAG: hypothetical protein AAF399_00240 [Bacteroidota bacterium]
MKEAKRQNDRLSSQLYALASQTEGETFSRLSTIARKVETCGNYVGIRQIPTGECFRIGANYCKCKACAVCSYLVSANRKKAILGYFEENPQALAGKHVYHAVFTLRHNGHTRSGDYTEELKAHFKSLRDSRATRSYWKDHVDGGFYSMEIVRNRSPDPSDKSLHIHLHVILVSPLALEKTRFARRMRQRWRAITGDSNQVFLERVYRMREDRTKEYYRPGQSLDLLKDAFAESVKYTLKLDLDFGGIEPETLSSLFKPHKRFFGFFGKLYGKGIATFSHEQIEALETEGNEIFSPSTGEIFDSSQTRLLITPFWNLQSRMVKGCPAYALEDREKAVFVPDLQTLAQRLARINDYLFEVAMQSKPGPAPEPPSREELQALKKWHWDNMTPAQQYHAKKWEREQARKARGRPGPAPTPPPLPELPF